MNGMWITFEGLGGSGKTTQLKLLEEYLTKQSFEILLTKEPGGTKTGGELRKILLSGLENEILTELFLFEADRHETFAKIIAPNLEKGKIILSDRGIDGSTAYQGFGRGLNVGLINQLTSLATNNKKPDLTILVDIEPRIARERIAERDNLEFDKFDKEDMAFQESVRKGFLYCAEQDFRRVRVVDGHGSVNEISNLIINIVDKFLDGKYYKG